MVIAGHWRPFRDLHLWGVCKDKVRNVNDPHLQSTHRNLEKKTAEKRDILYKRWSDPIIVAHMLRVLHPRCTIL